MNKFNRLYIFSVEYANMCFIFLHGDFAFKELQQNDHIFIVPDYVAN